MGEFIKNTYKQDKVRVSIITCVYNGADTIERCFNSVLNQTCKEFEHIIVNDGSTDDLDVKVNEYLKKADYPVVYYKKENGGKHTATNIAWDIMRGEYNIGLDADDALTDDAIENMLGVWESIPEAERTKYWCVLCRCKNPHTNDMIGKSYPENINKLSKRRRAHIAPKIRGEKLGMRRSECLKGLRYPVVEGVKFVNEMCVWGILNKRYETYYDNTIVRDYYTDTQYSLSRPKFNIQLIKNTYFNAYIMLKTRKNRKIFIRNYIQYYLKYSIYVNLVDNDFRKTVGEKFIGDTFSNVIVTVLKPVGFYIAKRKKRLLNH
jgi:glycosyltransferase involved in cell wall biosynthesis